MWEVRCRPLLPPPRLGPSVHYTVKPGDSVLRKDHVPHFPPLPSRSPQRFPRRRAKTSGAWPVSCPHTSSSSAIPSKCRGCLGASALGLPSVWKAVPTSLSPSRTGHFQLLWVSSVLPGPGRCSLQPAPSFRSIHCPCEKHFWDDLSSGCLLVVRLCGGGLCSLLSTPEPLVFLAHSRYSINKYIHIYFFK